MPPMLTVGVGLRVIGGIGAPVTSLSLDALSAACSHLSVRGAWGTSGAVFEDFRDVLFDPISEDADVKGGLSAKGCEAVFNLWRDRRVYGARKESIGFEGLQGLGEHLFADSADGAGRAPKSGACHRAI